MRTNTISMSLLASFAAAVAFGGSEATADGFATCGISAATVNSLQSKLATVINETDANGGLFKPNRMWSAIVDRQGKLCSVINSGNDPWPGSRAIAIAKATTANGFSNSAFALSTANLYGPTQPGRLALWAKQFQPVQPDLPDRGHGRRVRARRDHHLRRRRCAVSERQGHRRARRQRRHVLRGPRDLVSDASLSGSGRNAE